MSTNTLRFLAILLSALAMGMHLAHALELPAKLAWPPELYLSVQSSLYVWFGRIGPVLEVGALVVVAGLALRLRGGHAGFAAAALSATMLVLSLATWALLVMPANTALLQWQASGIQPADWMHWREQWQYGQAGILGLHLVGFSALVRSVLAAIRP